MPERLQSDPIEAARRNWVGHGWSDAADGMAAVTSIVRAQQILLGRIDATLRPFELTFARYEILMLLTFSSRGSLPMSRVGARLQVHPASVTSAVGRLESQGYVRRERATTDRRTVLATITDEGRALARRATTALNAGVFAHPGISPAATADLITILEQLRRDAGDF